MNPQNQSFFYFTRRERSGALVLIFFCLLVYLLPAWFESFRPPRAADFSTFQDALERMKQPPPSVADHPPENRYSLFYFDPNRASRDTLVELGLPVRTAENIINYRNKGGRFERVEDLKKMYTLREADYERLAPYVRISRSVSRQSAPPEESEEPVTLFPFNPNEVSARDLRRLGLSERAAATFIRYREKGARFFKPADIGKVYGVTEADVKRLSPFVRLPEQRADDKEEPSPEGLQKKESTSPLIDINRADAETWRRLYGIGPVLSARIVRFREKLGGFAGIEQVAETYGLPDSTFQSMRSRLIFSPITRPLAINRLDEAGLSDHPYIDRRLARAIVAYRIQNGPFKALTDLEKMYAMPEAVREKLKPYLSFD